MAIFADHKALTLWVLALLKAGGPSLARPLLTVKAATAYSCHPYGESLLQL